MDKLADGSEDVVAACRISVPIVHNSSVCYRKKKNWKQPMWASTGLVLMSLVMFVSTVVEFGCSFYHTLEVCSIFHVYQIIPVVSILCVKILFWIGDWN